jgi:hypothetical protein
MVRRGATLFCSMGFVMLTTEDMTGLRRQLAELQSMISTLENRMAAGREESVRDLAHDVAKARRAVLPQAYMTNIAWDILLDLDATERAGEQLVYPALDDWALQSPETQARYLGALEADDLISLTALSGHESRIIVSLTPTGRSSLDRVFASISSPLPSPPMAA